MVDESGMPDGIVEKTANALGSFSDCSSRAARRMLPTFYAKRDGKALGVRTDSVLKSAQRIQDSNLDEETKRIMLASLSVEYSHRENVNATVDIAIQSGRIHDNSSMDELGDEWVENFVDHVEKVSDEETQRLWAAVLSGEVNQPGTYSKRTMSILSDMSKSDAEAFKGFCSMCCGGRSISTGIEYWTQPYIILDDDGGGYNDHELAYADIARLDSLGLVLKDSNTRFQAGSQPIFCISGTPYIAAPMDGEAKLLTVGNCILTPFGNELSRLCDKGTHPKLHSIISKDLDTKGFYLLRVG